MTTAMDINKAVYDEWMIGEGSSKEEITLFQEKKIMDSDTRTTTVYRYKNRWDIKMLNCQDLLSD